MSGSDPLVKSVKGWILGVLAMVLTMENSFSQKAEPADVVIYGATSAGVVAAVQARRMGHSVILVEPGQHVGGLSSSGLGWTDSGNKKAIGGISREFYRRLKKHYDRPEAWKFEKPADLNKTKGWGRYDPKADAIWVFEPRVAEASFEAMLKEVGIVVMRGQSLDRVNGGVRKKGARILSLKLTSGLEVDGKMFIDASYEGDLFAEAGVSYHVGREANTVYGETLNGVQKTENKHNHRFKKKVDPYVVPGNPQSGLLPEIQAEPPGQDGSGDKRVQAYCYRMCMTRDPRNRVPFPKPEGYDAKRFELLFRNFEAGDLRIPMSPDMMPNRKTDTNNLGAISTDYIGRNYAYPEASDAERRKIIADHELYQKGLMWTLANHARVPEKVRTHMSEWGLAADEFVDNGNWPHQLYIREGRRMIGEYVMTEHDCRRKRIAKDSVGLGSYHMDSHNCQRYVAPDGSVRNEGDVQVSPGGVYAVSYRSIVPKESECENLLVPVSLSASHIAFGSIRMEPVFMILGQSAATGASLAIEGDVSVQDVPYDKLRKRLLADGQVLDIAATEEGK